MALRLLLWLVVFIVPSPSFACPTKCLCTEQGSRGSADYKRIVDCAGRLGDLNSIPWDIPDDTTNLWVNFFCVRKYFIKLLYFYYQVGHLVLIFYSSMLIFNLNLVRSLRGKIMQPRAVSKNNGCYSTLYWLVWKYIVTKLRNIFTSRSSYIFIF